MLSKNIKWYCFFKHGKCHVLWIPQCWMEYIYYRYSLDQYECVSDLKQAIKYMKKYNKRRL